jgi:hypothetical protein
MSFKAERFANGAVIAWDPLVRKHVVLDCHGVEHGYRRSLDDARAFAAGLPGEPYAEPQPAPIHVSPRAHPEIKARPGVTYEEPGVQPDEKPMPAKREPVVTVKYARGKAMTRRAR